MAQRTKHQEDNNACVVVQLEDAVICTKTLSRLGVKVKGVSTGENGQPKIKVDRAPRGLESSLVRYEGHGDGRTATRSASMNHCQIEWKETA